MKRVMTVVMLVLLCAAVWAQGEPVAQTQTANVTVTEARVSQPFAIDWAKVTTLAARIFAEPWIHGSKPEWHDSYPSPARITTTYGEPAKGDSLTPVDDRSKQRPCWVFWKDERSGVAVEKGHRGNWIVSTFVKNTEIVRVEMQVQVVEKPVIVEKPVYIPQPYAIPTPPVLIPARQYIPPAGVSAIWTPAIPVNTGATVVGPWHDLVTATLIYRPEPKPPPPTDGTCGPGTPPAPPPPSSPPVVAPPGNPSGLVNPPTPPGVGPPAPNVPDHGTHDHAGDINYSPADPNIADPVEPDQQPPTLGS